LASEVKIDQSISHDGCCLTVVALKENQYGQAVRYRVTAIDETLKRTNLQFRKLGDFINLERCTKIGSRLDGHIVQGHVDCLGRINEIIDVNGSWSILISYDKNENHQTVEKGSITINGVSLTVVESGPDSFSVAIIPYTWNNTNFCKMNVGDFVNLEFDIIGKYVAKILKTNKSLKL
jgi:riboflavin synthase